MRLHSFFAVDIQCSQLRRYFDGSLMAGAMRIVCFSDDRHSSCRYLLLLSQCHHHGGEENRWKEGF